MLTDDDFRLMQNDTVNSSVVVWWAVAAAISICYVRGMTHYKLGGRRMSLSQWDEGSDSDHVTGLNLDKRLGPL